MVAIYTYKFILFGENVYGEKKIKKGFLSCA